MKNDSVIVIFFVLVLLLGFLYISKPKPAENKKTPLPTQPMDTPTILGTKTNNAPIMSIDKNKTYTAVLHTSAGDISVNLHTSQTPITANNFISLAKKGFYNNTIFHRVIKGFMIQGGDPTGTGAGGPGYSFNDESFEGEYERGVVAMANAGHNTNGSQFFIMHTTYPLPKNYVIFGNVMEGMDIVNKIAESPVTISDSGEQSKPVTPTMIQSVDIIEK